MVFVSSDTFSHNEAINLMSGKVIFWYMSMIEYLIWSLFKLVFWRSKKLWTRKMLRYFITTLSFILLSNSSKSFAVQSEVCDKDQDVTSGSDLIFSCANKGYITYGEFGSISHKLFNLSLNKAMICWETHQTLIVWDQLSKLLSGVFNLYYLRETIIISPHLLWSYYEYLFRTTIHFTTKSIS